MIKNVLCVKVIDATATDGGKHHAQDDMTLLVLACDDPASVDIAKPFRRYFGALTPALRQAIKNTMPENVDVEEHRTHGEISYKLHQQCVLYWGEDAQTYLDRLHAGLSHAS